MAPDIQEGDVLLRTERGFSIERRSGDCITVLPVGFDGILDYAHWLRRNIDRIATSDLDRAAIESISECIIDGMKGVKDE